LIARILDGIIKCGIVILLGVSPLPFGSVLPRAYRTIEISVLVLLFIWIGKLALLREVRFIKFAFLIPVVIFIAYVLIQLIPLHPEFLHFISPETYALYDWTLWADPAGSILRNPQAGVLANRTFMPVSILASASATEILKIITYLGIFLLVSNNFNSSRDIRFLIWALVIFGFCYSLFALVQKFTWNGLAYWYVPLRPNRIPYGPFINKNHFAGYIMMIIPIAAGLVLTLKREGRSTHGHPKAWGEGIIAFLAFRRHTVFFFLVIMVSALIFSLSRGGYLSFLLSTGVFYLALRNKITLPQGKIPMFFSFCIAILLIGFLGQDEMSKRLDSLWDIGHMVWYNLRPAVWWDSLSILADFPVFGTGLATFKSIYPIYKTHHPELLFEFAENDYLQLVTETGAIGGLLMLAAIVLFTKFIRAHFSTMRSRRNILLTTALITSGISVGIQSFFDFSLHLPSNALHFTVIMGLLAATLTSHRRRMEGDTASLNAALSLRGAKGYAFYFFAALGSVLFVGSALSVSPSPEAPLIKLGIHQQYRFLLSLNANSRVALSHGRKAIGQFESARLLNPVNYKIHYLIGRIAGTIRARTGKTPKAKNGAPVDYRKYFRTAIRLNPFNSNLHYAIGSFYLNHWKFLDPEERKEGVSALKRAIKLTSHLKGKIESDIKRLMGKNIDPMLREII